VQTILQHDPFCGTIFVFRSKRADRVKMLVYDGIGLVTYRDLTNLVHRFVHVSHSVISRFNRSICEEGVFTLAQPSTSRRDCATPSRFSD
jgi:hypothetical protein